LAVPGSGGPPGPLWWGAGRLLVAEDDGGGDDVDGVGSGDGRDGPESSAARTGEDVDEEHALQQVGMLHSRRSLGSDGAVRGRFGWRGQNVAAYGRCDGVCTEVPDLVAPGWTYQGGETGDEGIRGKQESGDPAAGSLELVGDPAVDEALDPALRDRGSTEIANQTLELEGATRLDTGGGVDGEAVALAEQARSATTGRRGAASEVHLGGRLLCTAGKESVVGSAVRMAGRELGDAAGNVSGERVDLLLRRWRLGLEVDTESP